jgi:hypothetical protein
MVPVLPQAQSALAPEPPPVLNAAQARGRREVLLVPALLRVAELGAAGCWAGRRVPGLRVVPVLLPDAVQAPPGVAREPQGAGAAARCVSQVPPGAVRVLSGARAALSDVAAARPCAGRGVPEPRGHRAAAAAGWDARRLSAPVAVAPDAQRLSAPVAAALGGQPEAGDAPARRGGDYCNTRCRDAEPGRLPRSARGDGL